MDFREWKLELSVVAIAVLLMFAMLSLFRSISPSARIEAKEIVYEMPRPVSPELESEFDLANREITREYIKAQFKGVGQDKKSVAGIPKKTPAKNDKKKEAKKVAKADSRSKSQLKVNVIPGENKSKMSSGENFSNSKVARHFQNNNNQPNDTTPEPEKEDDKKVMTIEEWRQLLLAQPTLANMNKFLIAYRNKEISPQDYFQLSQELVTSNTKESQAAGLYALQSVPSATSFSIIAKNLSKLAPETHATAQKILLSYSEPQRLGYLSQALQSTDPEVVKQAAETITYGLAQVKRGPPSPSGTAGNNSTSSSTLQSYGRFLQVFETWQQSGDQTLMGLAQNFLTTWNS